MADQYCTIAELDLQYGASNTNTWANLNGGPLTDQTTLDEIEAKKLDAIETASRWVDDRLRNHGYQVPFTLPVPHSVMHLTRIQAGYELHSARGEEDNVDDETDPMINKRRQASKLLSQILSSQMELELPRNKSQGSV